MMIGDDEVDQDAMAAAWGAELGDDDDDSGGGDAKDPNDAMADEWGAMLEGEDGDQDDLAAEWEAMGGVEEEDVGNQGNTERILNQDEIDSLLGFNLDDADASNRNGIRAIINSTLVSYERLPMLEIVFDRLVRLMTTSLRNFTSDNVEVSLDNISSIRFGDYLNSIPLPAMLAVFKVAEWDNYGLITIESNLIYSIVDVLLGGRQGTKVARIEGRPYTTIESSLIERLIEVVLEDMEVAFEPLTNVTLNLDRLETNPRFAAIARSANAAILVKMRVDMEDRGGNVEFMIPYATFEPIRDLLLQGFMGEKFGHDSIWEGHLATEIWSTRVEVEAVLEEQMMRLGEVMNLQVGQTVMLNCGPESQVNLRCNGVPLTSGLMGQKEDNIAIRVDHEFVTSRLQMMKNMGMDAMQELEAVE